MIHESLCVCVCEKGERIKQKKGKKTLIDTDNSGDDQRERGRRKVEEVIKGINGDGRRFDWEW